MKMIRVAADELMTAERDQTAQLVELRRKAEYELCFVERERARLEVALEDAKETIRNAYAEAAQALAERDATAEAHRATSAELEQMGRELAAAQLQGVNEARSLQEELTSTRTQLTFTSSQLAGLQLQHGAKAARHAEAEAELHKLRHSVRAANERADGAATAARQAQVHAGEVEADKQQLQVLRATLVSKLELKDEQLVEMQAAHRSVRGQLHEARAQLLEQLRAATPPGRPSLDGARGRIEGFREAQEQLRAVRQHLRHAAQQVGC